MKYPECKQCSELVGPVNLWANIGLCVLKLLFGVLSRSSALVADAFHSIADILASLVLLVSIALSKRPADEHYHFGYGKFDFICAVIIGIMIIAVGLGIIGSAITELVRGELETPKQIAIAVALVSIMANWFLYKHCICVGKQMKSSAVMAAGWENRVDVLSSVAALVGIVFARLGYPAMDPISAAIIGILILWSGYDVIKEAVGGMSDEAALVTEDDIQSVSDIISGESEAYRKRLNLRNVKSRNVGPTIELGLVLETEEDLSILEANKIVERIKGKIRATMADVGDIIVQIRGVPS